MFAHKVFINFLVQFEAIEPLGFDVIADAGNEGDVLTFRLGFFYVENYLELAPAAVGTGVTSDPAPVAPPSAAPAADTTPPPPPPPWTVDEARGEEVSKKMLVEYLQSVAPREWLSARNLGGKSAAKSAKKAALADAYRDWVSTIAL